MEETGRKKKVPARRRVARKKLKKKPTESYEVCEVTNMVGGLTLPGLPTIVVGDIEETRSQPGSRRGSRADPEARAREMVRRESVALRLSQSVATWQQNGRCERRKGIFFSPGEMSASF